jgi:hypothetical protein
MTNSTRGIFLMTWTMNVLLRVTIFTDGAGGKFNQWLILMI